MRSLLEKLRLIVLYAIPILLLTLSFTLFCSLFFQKRSQRTDYTHRYLEFDPYTNKTNVGFVAASENQFTGDFLSYEDGSGKYVLISKLGDHLLQYKCTGRCVCETRNSDNIQRRVMSSSMKAVSQKMIILVAAVSSAIATKLSIEILEEDCDVIIGDDECYSDTQSEIDECRVIPDSSNFFGMDPEGNMLRRYRCQGRCLNNEFSEEDNAPTDYNCDKLDLQKDVTFQIPHIFQQEVRSSPHDDALGYRSICTQFYIKDHLHHHCFLHSREVTDHGLFHMCRGWDPEDIALNPFVTCVDLPWDDYNEHEEIT